jgi:hypothetical protein
MGDARRLRPFDIAFDLCAALEPGQDVELDPAGEAMLMNAIRRAGVKISERRRRRDLSQFMRL